MIVQATTRYWDKKFKACKTENERIELILNSGEHTAACRIDMKDLVEFYRPSIGNFVVHGISETDDFRYPEVEDAISKSKELRQLLTEQLNRIYRAMVHVNEIKLEGEDKFTKQFNLCSEYWKNAHDELLSEDERKKNLDLWFEERQRLELGMY